MAGMGLKGMDHSNSNHVVPVKTIVKEVLTDKYIFAVEFSSPQLHSRVNYLLQIHDTQTRKKITRAEVILEVAGTDSKGATDSENVIQVKAEQDDNGDFVASYTFHSENEIYMVFKVLSVEENKMIPTIEIATTQKPIVTQDEYGGGGMNSIWTVGIGVVIMAAMMYFVRF